VDETSNDEASDPAGDFTASGLIAHGRRIVPKTSHRVPGGASPIDSPAAGELG
jgi:hypothetical protein